MSRRTIHHFDDEPKTMGWIPGSLFNYYYRLDPRLVGGQDSYRVAGRRVSFDLYPRGEMVTVEYRFYKAKEEFLIEFETDAQDGDLVFLDVMANHPTNAEVRDDGIDLFQVAAGRLPSTAIFFLTAYPRRIPDQVKSRLPQENILLKPVDGVLIEMVADRFDIR